MRIPIANQLKKLVQVETTYLQDEIVQLIYSITEDIIFHGGTAIWRCYGGKRFSDGLDFYSSSVYWVNKQFRQEISRRSLSILRLKDTGNVVFAALSNGNRTVKVEINHAKTVRGIPTSYELIDGSEIEVLSLSVDQLIIEKIAAYNDRKYIHDLYDIYHLTSINKVSYATLEALRQFLQNTAKPVDETVLKTVVYSGLAPSYSRMIELLKRVSG